MKVLCVDDSNLIVSILKNFILGYDKTAQVFEAHNGDEAVTMFAQYNPDLVFLDIIMPGKDGLTALQEIRAKNTSAKVVMCTSLKEANQEAKAKELGAVGYITKPFSKDDIANAIKKNTA